MFKKALLATAIAATASFATWDYFPVQEAGKGQVLSLEVQSGEGIGRKDDHQQHGAGRRQGEDESIEEVLRQWDSGEGFHIIF